MANLQGSAANRLLEEASGLSPWEASQGKLKEEVKQNKMVTVNNFEKWRFPFLNKLLGQRRELAQLCKDIKETFKHKLINYFMCYVHEHNFLQQDLPKHGGLTIAPEFRNI